MTRLDQGNAWKIVTAPLWVVGVVIVGALGLVLSPILVPLKLFYDQYEKTTFCRRFEGRVILIWTPRHKWAGFVVSNLLPALPSNVEPIPNPTILIGSEPLIGLGLAKRKSNLTGLRRPYLFSVRDKRITFVGLHEELLPFKGNQKPDSTIQMRVASILELKLLQMSNADATVYDKPIDR